MSRVRSLRSIGLKGRVAALLASGLVLGALLTALFFLSINQVSSAYLRANAARQLRGDNLNLLLAMTQQDAAIDSFVATGNPAALGDYRAATARADDTYATLLREVRDSHERDLLKEMGADRTEWQAMLAARAAAPADSAIAGQADAQFQHLRDDDGVLQDALTADYMGALADARSSTLAAQVAVVLGAATGAAALLLLARLFLRSTLSPLLALLRTAERMASGSIVQVPNTERQDEVGALARALVAWDHTARRQGALERQAEETEIRYQHLFRSAPVGIARAGLTGRIQEANPALGEMLGLERRTLRTKHLGDLLETQEPGQLAEACELVASGTATSRTVLGRRVRADGSVRWLEVAVSTLAGPRDRQPVALVAMFEDVTAIQRSLERLRAINRIGQAILEGQPMPAVEQAIAENARDLVGADLAAVATTGSPEDDLVVRAAVGLGEEDYRGQRIPRRGSLAGAALDQGETMISADVREDERTSNGNVARLDVGALAAAPVGHDGVIVVMNRRGGVQFDPGDIELLGTFARQAALAYEYERSQEHVRQLRLLEERERIAKDLQDSVIQSLFGIGLTLQAAAMRAGAADVAERIEAAEAELDVTIRRMRNLVFGLMPNMDADRHLDIALRHIAEEFTLSSGVRVDTDVDQPLAAELSSAAPALLGLTRLALAPTGSFAAGGPVRLRLHRVDGHGVLDIGSDRPAGDLQELDLAAFENLVRDLRGKVEVRPASGRRGTTLRVRVPVERATARAGG